MSAESNGKEKLSREREKIGKLCYSGTSEENLGERVSERGQIMQHFECQEYPNSLG